MRLTLLQMLFWIMLIVHRSWTSKTVYESCNRVFDYLLLYLSLQKGNTALTHACIKKKYEVVRRLLSMNADKFIKNDVSHCVNIFAS